MNLDQFKQLNTQIGHYWFSPDTMRFFRTKIHDWNSVTGYFITSEINWSEEKRYSIRKADFKTGQVKTVGEFHSYKTLQAARKALQEMK